MGHQQASTFPPFRPLLLLFLCLFLDTTTPWVLFPPAASHLITNNRAGSVLALLPGRRSKGHRADVTIGAAEIQSELGVEADPPTIQPAAMKVKRESTSHLLFWLVSWPPRTRLPGLRLPVFLNVIWTSLVVYCYSRGFIPTLDASAHTYVGGPLGFLLAFRCSSGLARTDKGREVSPQDD